MLRTLRQWFSAANLRSLVKWKSLLVSWVSQLNLKSAASLSFRQATHLLLFHSMSWEAEGAPGQWKAYSSSHSLQGGSRGCPPAWGQLPALLGWCHRAAQGSASSAQAPGSIRLVSYWGACLYLLGLLSAPEHCSPLKKTGMDRATFPNWHHSLKCPVLFPLQVRCLKWQNLRKSEGLKPLTVFQHHTEPSSPWGAVERGLNPCSEQKPPACSTHSALTSLLALLPRQGASPGSAELSVSRSQISPLCFPQAPKT